MRWGTFRTSDGQRVGAVVGDEVRLLAGPQNLVERLDAGTLPASLAQLSGTESVPLADLTTCAPIPVPPSVRDFIGFLDHMRAVQVVRGERAELSPVWFETPPFYFGAPASVVGPFDDVAIAPGSSRFDFELEIAAVIGRRGRDLAVEQAQAAIAGYTIYCDWSARDLQLIDRALGIGQGKGKDAATTLGPWLVTPDELPPHSATTTVDLGVQALVNGRVVGSGRTGTMDWSLAELVSYASRGIELQPGDVIGSGTVPSCTLIELMGEGFPGWLVAGDVVELVVDGLGATRQRVVAGHTPVPLAPRPQQASTPPSA